MKRLIILVVLGSFAFSSFAQIVGAKSASFRKYGFVDANGNWVIQPIYEFTYWHEEWKLGTFRNQFGGPEGLIDASGKVIFPIGRYKQYYYSRNFITITDMNEKKGVATLSGDVIVPCLYEEIYIDENGYIRVKSVGKFGLRNQEGREIVPCLYEKIYTDENGYIQVKAIGKFGLQNQEGREIIPCKYDEISMWMLEKGDYCDVKLNGKKGLYHIKKKKELLPCVFDYISYDVKIGGFKVEQNDKYGLYSIDGKEIIPCKYEYLSYQEKTGFIKVEQNDKYGLYSVEGKEMIPCKYDGISDYHYKDSGCFEVKKDKKEGVYDSKGNELIPCIYDDVFIQDDYITFELNGKEGLYSIKEMKVILKCEYNYLCHPHEGLVVFRMEKDGKYGYMDLKGKVVIEPQYDNAASFKEGVAQVTKDGVTSIIKHPLHGTNLNIATGEDVWVDIDIPVTTKQNEEAFAFIIANEDYTHFSGANYSHNDGKVFAEYCKKVLGMPENNVRYYEDATFGNIANALKQLKDIADVYDGDAKIVFYFSGLGITDDKTNERYILSSDASLTALASTGYNVTELMTTLNQLKTKYTILVVDAPFNGNDKSGKPLASGRGVRIANKQIPPMSSVIGLIGSDDGKGFSSKQLQHGILTYYILEKLKSSKGDCSISELFDDSCQKTKTESLKLFKDVQSPGVIVSNNVVLNTKM